MIDPNCHYDIADFARLAGLSVSEVHELIASGQLAGKQHRSLWTISQAEAARYMEAKRGSR